MPTASPTFAPTYYIIHLASVNVSTLAGSGLFPHNNVNDGVGRNATFHYVDGICMDSKEEHLFVLEKITNSIRKVNIRNQSVSTFASGKYCCSQNVFLCLIFTIRWKHFLSYGMCRH